MTPQLQQAIRMLQLSAVELQQEVQEIMEGNPLLEEGEEESSTPEHSGDQSSAASGEEKIAPKESATTGENTIPEELDTDSSWEDTYDIPSMLGNASPNEGFESQEVHSSAPSLQDHLIWQLNTLHLSDRDYAISITLIDAINQKGYLESPPEELSDSLQLDPPVEIDELTTQLHQVQQFDPSGVGARDLRECLLVQLRQTRADTLAKVVSLDLLENHFDLTSELVSSGRGDKLCRTLRTDSKTVAEALELIRTLDPNPGEQIEPPAVEYVIPDLIIKKSGEHWDIELTPETSPKLRISPFYQSIKNRAQSGNDKEYLNRNIQEAHWLLKSLQNRNETLLKVATHVFRVQSGFLEAGPEKMQALTLRTIADAIEMHESTVSRVTTNKYVQTPQGIFELKYFFSSQLNTVDGDGTSSTAVRAMIRQIVDNEDSIKPISDNRITMMLAEKGVKVARRTVAKYRNILSIPPSNERKRSP